MNFLFEAYLLENTYHIKDSEFPLELNLRIVMDKFQGNEHNE